MIDKLAAAIKAGMYYHIFNKENGQLLHSVYLPKTAENIAKTYEGKAIVKYLTNVCTIKEAA